MTHFLRAVCLALVLCAGLAMLAPASARAQYYQPYSCPAPAVYPAPVVASSYYAPAPVSYAAPAPVYTSYYAAPAPIYTSSYYAPAYSYSSYYPSAAYYSSYYGGGSYYRPGLFWRRYNRATVTPY